jgi:CHC2-type zinc finger protein
MSAELAKAKAALPLPALMHQVGLGEHAKKSTRCPFHDDKHNSFSVWRNDGELWFFKCHAGCGQGDEITFLELHERISTSEAIKLYLEMAGVNGQTQSASKQTSTFAFDWNACVEAVTEKHLKHLADWRSYSLENLREWHSRGLIGHHDGCIAFPLHDRAGTVVAAHCRGEDGSWFYYPKGAKIRPLVVGELVPGDRVQVFESTWDGLAYMDKSGEGNGIIITRGASNAALVADLISKNSTVYVWTQNDSAGEKWQRDICANTQGAVKRVRIPAPHKDLNDWTRARATSNDLLAAMMSARDSLNSQFPAFAQFDDYPEPLAPAAFYGLAGEIVRRIEPHTEADPAALLIQFLAAYGSVIGRTAYAMADGAHHYLNIYGVLVGQSSKGRKGTSWNQIARLFALIDEVWRRDKVISGLSSGEGLIWVVRDPIEEKKEIKVKGRHTGEYETVVIDFGIADKRLLVIEAEFANVLKVMAREGNTLSPVIRSAWDSGNLRTIVKNSPAMATDAHISIIGHITRDELPRLLTQTESANGFANRFLWLAVKRSKYLPEGGAINTIKFNDLLDRLRAAVEFAPDVAEITRDEEARRLWCEVYPDLSDGKPGMAGAVTGRAEAQVLRLSAIYALLDKSRLIRPEHHLAAMAVWKYCEESARWIFGTSTGDRNADKILVALRHAPNGMTKTEISAEVFNRHASSAEIDEALRLLHGLHMVRYETEATGGAPLQRWFFTGETREKSE